jgi:hypothetical protein
MPREPKDKEPDCENNPEEPDADTWSEDQKRREYYYDDAHGYEVYEPEEDEVEVEVEEDDENEAEH